MAKVNANLKKRCLSAIAVILVFGFGIDILRLFWFQVIKSDEYRIKAEAQQLSDTVISADRGVIYDASMNVLAESAAAWLVYAVYESPASPAPPLSHTPWSRCATWCSTLPMSRSRWTGTTWHYTPYTLCGLKKSWDCNGRTLTSWSRRSGLSALLRIPTEMRPF